MKKYILLAALAAASPAAAANPFSDVPAGHWSLEAVEALADKGVLTGYPDGAFRGEEPVTRYEMAQATARLLAKEDRLSPEDRKTADRLAAEYAEELDGLGVRVSALEERAGRFSWSGEARSRYQKFTENKDNGKNDSRNGLIRLSARAAVNDRTEVFGRLTSGDIDWDEGGDSSLSMDRMYARHTFGSAALTVGRYELDMGQDKWLSGNAFDGAALRWQPADSLSLSAGFGRFSDADYGSLTEAYKSRYGAAEDDAFGDAESFWAKAETALPFGDLDLDYIHASSFTRTDGNRGGAQITGGTLTVPMTDGFRLSGSYHKDTDASGDPRVWSVGAGFGKMIPEKRWSFRADVGYYSVEEGLYHSGMSGLDIDDRIFLENGHFWLASGDIAVGKNIYMHGEYAFAQDSDDGENTGDTWSISTYYRF